MIPIAQKIQIRRNMKKKISTLLIGLVMFVSAFAVTSFANNLLMANRSEPCSECFNKDNNGCGLSGCTYLKGKNGEWYVSCSYARCNDGFAIETEGVE